MQFLFAQVDDVYSNPNKIDDRHVITKSWIPLDTCPVSSAINNENFLSSIRSFDDSEVLTIKANDGPN